MQPSPSLQVLPAGRLTKLQPVMFALLGSQTLIWHDSAVVYWLQSSNFPAWHAPFWQLSLTVQALPSASQGVPSGWALVLHT